MQLKCNTSKLKETQGHRKDKKKNTYNEKHQIQRKKINQARTEIQQKNKYTEALQETQANSENVSKNMPEIQKIQPNT